MWFLQALKASESDSDYDLLTGPQLGPEGLLDQDKTPGNTSLPTTDWSHQVDDWFNKAVLSGDKPSDSGLFDEDLPTAQPKSSNVCYLPLPATLSDVHPSVSIRRFCQVCGLTVTKVWHSGWVGMGRVCVGVDLCWICVGLCVGAVQV